MLRARMKDQEGARTHHRSAVLDRALRRLLMDGRSRACILGRLAGDEEAEVFGCGEDALFAVRKSEINSHRLDGVDSQSR